MKIDFARNTRRNMVANALCSGTRLLFPFLNRTLFLWLLVAASRRLFPDIEPRGRLPDDLRAKVLSDVKSIFMHKVGGVVVNSMDNLVVSAFLGLVAVAAALCALAWLAARAVPLDGFAGLAAKGCAAAGAAMLALFRGDVRAALKRGR